MKWNPDYLLRSVAEEYVLVPVAGEAAKSSRIVAINQTAGEICALLQQGQTEREVVDTLLQRYDADRAELEQDVSRTLQSLQGIGAVLP